MIQCWLRKIQIQIQFSLLSLLPLSSIVIHPGPHSYMFLPGEGNSHTVRVLWSGWIHVLYSLTLFSKSLPMRWAVFSTCTECLPPLQSLNLVYWTSRTQKNHICYLLCLSWWVCCCEPHWIVQFILLPQQSWLMVDDEESVGEQGFSLLEVKSLENGYSHRSFLNI